ncbi:MAG TPA: hypothetical protein VM913_01075, partial [Sphingomicrobium sp.]|nr:hypothetical protein [Sphingomicrobium sp.]
AVQIGYTIADIVAKAGLGVVIYLIAVRKSAVEYGDADTAYAAGQARTATSRAQSGPTGCHLAAGDTTSRAGSSRPADR